MKSVEASSTAPFDVTSPFTGVFIQLLYYRGRIPKPLRATGVRNGHRESDSFKFVKRNFGKVGM
jgi:hypothetical protein